MFATWSSFVWWSMPKIVNDTFCAASVYCGEKVTVIVRLLFVCRFPARSSDGRTGDCPPSRRLSTSGVMDPVPSEFWVVNVFNWPPKLTVMSVVPSPFISIDFDVAPAAHATVDQSSTTAWLPAQLRRSKAGVMNDAQKRRILEIIAFSVPWFHRAFALPQPRCASYCSA